MIVVTSIRLMTHLAIPGWTTTVFGFFAILMVQVATFLFMFCCLFLYTRGLSAFIPRRDYAFFKLDVEEISFGEH